LTEQRAFYSGPPQKIFGRGPRAIEKPSYNND